MATLRRLRLPEEVIRAVRDPANYEKIGTTALASGLLEAMYYTRRAVGLKTKATENDGADIYFGCYMFVATILVTDDGSLRQFLRELLTDGRRVMCLAEFMDWLLEDSAA